MRVFRYKMKKLVIWDWNGTILDDLDICMSSINTMFARRGMPLFEAKEQYYKHFQFPIINYYRSVGFDFAKERYADLAKEYIQMYYEKLPDCPLAAGVTQTLERFKRAGLRQLILSAAERSSIKENLDLKNITDYFDPILGLDDFYAKGKEDIALDWIKRTGADMRQAVMLGDTEHDAKVADILGCDCILIRGGHNGEEKLKASGKRVVDNAIEAADIILNGGF